MYKTRIECYYEKRAGWLGAGIAHIAQNAFTKKVLPRYQGYLNNVAHNFAAGATGKVPATGRTIAGGLLSIVSPESKIISSHMQQAGGRFKEALATHGLTYEQLPEHVHGHLSNISKGVYTPETKAFMKTPVGQSLSQSVSGMKHMPTDALEAVQNNTLAGKLIKGFYRSPHDTAVRGLKEPTKWNKAIHKATDVGTEAVGNLAVAAVDPVTAGVNVAKRVITSEQAGHKVPLLKRVQGLFNRKVIAEPAQANYAKGVAGAPVVTKNSPSSLVKDYALNPVTSSIVSGAGEAGQVIRKANN